MNYNRRKFIETTIKGSATLAVTSAFSFPNKNTRNVEVVNPLNRIPVSLIIDDSTTLVNMAYYGIPQFAAIFPENYTQDWRKLPREIPDSFVRKFGEWAIEKGVKGKYSIVPYPSCTGWVSRFIPGWTEKEMKDSLNLVREVIVPNWDIHPEMVSHTRVIDIKTGRPFPKATPEFMENWEWSQNKSADELASYQAYALNILKEAGLSCEGITTPGGYGGKNQDNLALGTLQAVRDVYGAEVPHYFRDLFTEKGKSVAPIVKYPSDLNTDDPKCVVSVLGCTGDWFGGWDGLTPGNADKHITADLQSGRLVDVIESGEPAIMVCHWPGIYYNGDELGFNILKQVVERLHKKYDNLIWMKLSEIARYWAAKELTQISVNKNTIQLKAPFATSNFTLKIEGTVKAPEIKNAKPMERVSDANALKNNSFCIGKKETLFCLDLPRGNTEINI